jgi:predicted PurR-regulated permease PerM
MRNEVAIARSLAVMAVLGMVAALYFAKAVFLPLALAILLTFLLAPAVRLLRRAGDCPSLWPWSWSSCLRSLSYWASARWSASK